MTVLSINLEEWRIPIWLKIVVASIALGCAGILLRALTSTQASIFGMSTSSIGISAAALFVMILPFVISFWFCPASYFSRLAYWLLRLFRGQIYVFALLGILYLIIIKAPILSFRGGIPYAGMLGIFLAGYFLKPAGFYDAPHANLNRLLLKAKNYFTRLELIPLWVLQWVVALLPVTAVLFVIYVVFGSRLANYGPYSFWNDEVAYWVWLRSFIAVGFNSGYNAPNELLAPFAFSRYGEASPFYVYIYGAIGKLVGWSATLPVLINFVLLTLSIYLFLRRMKFDHYQMLVTGLTVFLTWPVLLYLPLSTHETLNQVIGIMLVIVIAIFTSDKASGTFTARLAIVCFVYVATLVRLSWGLMLIPVLYYSLPGKGLQRIALAVLLGGGLFLSAVVLIGKFLPPINNSVMDMFRASISDGPVVFWELVKRQFRIMFRFQEFTPNMAVILQMGLIGAWSSRRVRDLVKANHSLTSIMGNDAIFEFYTVSSLLIAGFTFYIQMGFYRVFTPAILMIFLLMIARRDYRHLVALLTINILFANSYMFFYARIGDFEIARSDYSNAAPALSEIGAQIDEIVVYDPKAKSPWCNTVLIPLNFYDWRIIMFPPGFGVSYIPKKN